MDRTAIPVAIVTGFLGAGKTTLLNRLLRDPALADALVIVNEWGEIGLDHLLIERVEGDVILLASGCLCCSLRGDLAEALSGLIARRDEGRIARFSRIVIETTGLADPAPVLHALAADPMLAQRLGPAAIVTLVDAVNGAANLADRSEPRRQVAMADRLVVSKSDLLDGADRPGRVADLRAALRSINALAPILDGAAGEFSAADFVAIDSSDLDAKSAQARGWASSDRSPHSHGIATHSLRWAEPIHPHALSMFLDLLRSAHGPRLLRVKGLVALAGSPGQPLLIHGAQHVFHPPRRLGAWPDADHATRIIFITEGLEAGAIDRLWSALVGAPAIDQPDQAALVANPLAVTRGGLLA